MASQKHYESLDDGSEFSGPPCSQLPFTQPYEVASDSDMDLSSDGSSDAAAPAPPQTDADKRIFRAAAFLKKAEQEAAASEHCVFGARAAALELTKMHAKKVAAVANAAKRLKAAKAAPRAAPRDAAETAAALEQVKAVLSAATEQTASEAPKEKTTAKVPKASKTPRGDAEERGGSKKKK